jgi:ABC-type glutathione transport system ATPase component
MRTRDGQQLTGDTPEAIVTALHDLAFEREASDQAYMLETARLVMLQSGERIRHDTAENFVADLLRVGLLVDKPPPDKSRSVRK